MNFQIKSLSLNNFKQNIQKIVSKCIKNYKLQKIKLLKQIIKNILLINTIRTAISSKIKAKIKAI